MKRLVIFSALLGLLIPCAWIAADILMPHLMFEVTRHFNLHRALVLIWPSSLLLIADPDNSNMPLQAASVALNAVLYGIAGWLIWLGVRKSKWVLVLTIATILFGWVYLLGL